MKIHKTAIIEDGAKLGKNVEVGPFTHIGKKVVIGNNVVIQGDCEIGINSSKNNKKKIFIGDNSLIRSKSIFYAGSTFGPNLVTGHRVTVREGVKAGKNLQIGTLTDIQGDCKIGDYVRQHSNIFISQLTKIGNFVWIFPHAVLTNDPTPPSSKFKGVTVEDYVVIAAGSLILPGVILREGTLVGAKSKIRKSTNAHTLVSGNPAVEKCSTSKIKLKYGSKKSAYPWIRHFHRGYPIEIIKEWKRKFKN